MAKRKTESRKSVSWLARLTACQVRKIRLMLRGGCNQADIAVTFGVSQSTISMIARGKIYRGVR